MRVNFDKAEIVGDAPVLSSPRSEYLRYLFRRLELRDDPAVSVVDQ
jgi:hypothetical protein